MKKNKTKINIWSLLLKFHLLVLAAAAVFFGPAAILLEGAPPAPILSIFQNNPSAVEVITNLMAEPQPPLSVPLVVNTNSGAYGTYWMLTAPGPLPFDLYPDLPVYQVSTNPDFIIDDRSVDYAALEAEETTNDTDTFFPEAGGGMSIDTNSLWLEVPTNALSVSNVFNVLIHNTINGDFYDVLTKTDLLLPLWTSEMTVTGAVGNVTPVSLSQNGRTNLFVWARMAAVTIYTQPMSQEVFVGDTVTFSVDADGTALSYQWTFDGTNIFDATGSSYTIDLVQTTNAGDYACVITSAAGTVTSQTATLAVDGDLGDPDDMVVLGPRQDYTFRDGFEYYIGSTVQLYGKTTFEGGTVLKYDYTQQFPSLQIMGTLCCKGTAYNPSILTTVDDDEYGEWWSYGPPAPVPTGVPYLDLTLAESASVENVHFRYADEALATPAGGCLDVWDCQFFQCNAGVINEFGGIDRLHNVLFAECFDALAALTNDFAITAEHVTVDAANFCDSSIPAAFIGLTNCIVLGNVGSASAYFAPNTSIDPGYSIFQTNASGNYYLAIGCSLHNMGTTNVTPSLLNEFHSKTTYAPIAFPAQSSISGNLTLFPQIPRYTNGPPYIGYFYDALDYTVAALTNFGSITVEPGTAIGFRENINQYGLGTAYLSDWGFDEREYSSFIAHGAPNKPIVFADAQMVDEQYLSPCFSDFVPDFQGNTNDIGPTLDFRFCDFYAAPRAYEVWSGMDSAGESMDSYNSVVNWTMRDCELVDGQISLGEPDSTGLYGDDPGFLASLIRPFTVPALYRGTTTFLIRSRSTSNQPTTGTAEW
ncbi:MAG TPA: immunoglobulin domain-containing protein [Candidatus Sulfotelmatobacter sp.]|nr:immunoglobulin domain-containing protein [Candidatus Sulfotelmatobacter sp.]